MATIWMSYFKTGGPSKEVRNIELISHHQPEEFTNGKKKKKRERERHHVSYHLPESFSQALILADQGVHHQEGPWVRMIGRENPETNPINIKPKTASHVTEQSSWVPSPSCSSPGRPFPIKSLALSAYVSPWTIHFWVKDKSALSGLGRGPPSYNQTLGLCPRGKGPLSLPRIIAKPTTTEKAHCNDSHSQPSRKLCWRQHPWPKLNAYGIFQSE